MRAVVRRRKTKAVATETDRTQPFLRDAPPAPGSIRLSECITSTCVEIDIQTRISIISVDIYIYMVPPPPKDLGVFLVLGSVLGF